MANEKWKVREHRPPEDRAAFALWLLGRFEGWSHAPASDARVTHAEDQLRSRVRSLVESHGADRPVKPP